MERNRPFGMPPAQSPNWPKIFAIEHSHEGEVVFKNLCKTSGIMVVVGFRLVTIGPFSGGQILQIFAVKVMTRKRNKFYITRILVMLTATGIAALSSTASGQILIDSDDLDGECTVSGMYSLDNGIIQSEGTFSFDAFEVLQIADRTVNTFLGENALSIVPDNSFGIIAAGALDAFLGSQGIQIPGNILGEGAMPVTIGIEGDSVLGQVFDIATIGLGEDLNALAVTAEINDDTSFVVAIGVSDPTIDGWAFTIPGEVLALLGSPFLIDDANIDNIFHQLCSPGEDSSLGLNFVAVQNGLPNSIAEFNLRVSGGAVAVPEPGSTSVLLMIGLATSLRRRK